MSVPLKLIDPRRPVGEPNKVEKAEGLMQYSPFLPAIPQAVINYYRAVSACVLQQNIASGTRSC